MAFLSSFLESAVWRDLADFSLDGCFSVSPEVYKMIYRFFPPKSFRTHNRDSVEAERSLELVNEEVSSSLIQDMIVKAGSHNQLKFSEGVPPTFYHPAERNKEDVDNGRKCDVYFSATIGAVEYR